jgi:NAD(P)-dependent dehydrogenase (short-subunit alcohol dehydrogenase family)
MTLELADQVALVTGADQGLGRASALALAKAGAYRRRGYRRSARRGDDRSHHVNATSRFSGAGRRWRSAGY